MVQVSHLYLTTGKTTSLTTWDLYQQSDVSAFSYTVKVCHSLILLRGLNSARVLHRMTVIVIIMLRAPSLVTGCHQGHVHPLDQRQEADDPICPTGPVMLCQPHTFSAGDRLAWKGRAQRLSVATITPSDAGRRKTCGGVAHCPPSSKCLLSLKEV